MTDGNGDRSAFEFQRGLLVAETRTLDGDAPATTSYVYDDDLALVATIDPNRFLWRTTRDAAGNVLTSTDPLGRTTTATWSEQNDLTSITTPLGITTRIGYDDRGLPVRIVRAAGTPEEATTTFGRDDPEHPSDVTSVTDPMGAVTTFTYDEHGVGHRRRRCARRHQHHDPGRPRLGRGARPTRWAPSRPSAGTRSATRSA